jgi:hypothetical protein
MTNDNSDPAKTAPIHIKSEDKTVSEYSLPKGHFLTLRRRRRRMRSLPSPHLRTNIRNTVPSETGDGRDFIIAGFHTGIHSVIFCFQV